MSDGALPFGARSYSLELKNLDGMTVRFNASWTDEEYRNALDVILRIESGTPSDATAICWIEVRDAKGALRLAIAWDWTEKDRRLALLKMARGLPGAVSTARSVPITAAAVLRPPRAADATQGSPSRD